MEIYAPLADRLGMQRIKSELEDLAFRYLEPEEFRVLSGKLHKTQKERDHYIETRVAHDHLALGRAGLRRRSVRAAPSTCCSIHRKMKEQQCEFEQVYDIVAFRICVEIGGGLLRRARRHALEVDADPRALQGLHRAAQAEHVPVAAHDGDRPGPAAHRDSDPHPRDAPRGRARHRRALEVQRARLGRGRSEGRRALRLAARADGVPARPQGPGRVPREREGRPLPGRGLRLHAQG